MLKQLSTVLLSAVISVNAFAAADLNPAKQAFYKTLNAVSQDFKKSVQAMQQNEQKLQKSRAALQKKQHDNTLTQPEKQCVVALLDRANRSYSLVRSTINNVKQYDNQLTALRGFVQRATVEQQMKQAADKGNQIIKQMDTMFAKNRTMSQQWSKNVKTICDRVPAPAK
jgi:predicted DNA-binding protein YlxM (UPF0122 family)